jgi:flagellar biosynthesis protein FlhB
MKYKNLHMKVLLILTVYLFFSITNAFFASNQTRPFTTGSLLKPATSTVFHLPKTNRAIISQTRASVNQLVQSAAQFFIVLLVSAGLLKNRSKRVTAFLFYRPDRHYSYLRHCVIRV